MKVNGKLGWWGRVRNEESVRGPVKMFRGCNLVQDKGLVHCRCVRVTVSIPVGVLLDGSGRGRDGQVEVLDFEALEDLEDLVALMEVVVHYSRVSHVQDQLKEKSNDVPTLTK